MTSGPAKAFLRTLWGPGLCGLLLATLGSSTSPTLAQPAETEATAAPLPIVVEEATIPELRAALLEGRLTARQLVEHYLERIEAYDRQGPSLNALIVVNPRALERAEALDAALAAGEPTGPLHGIPVIVKDNYDTADLPTTAGSLSLAESIPPDDAFQVRQLRDAGAIVLAKSNMAEFAFSPYETVGSALPGYTRNPYDTRRVTAGSSGGTAAAVAANLGAVGLGTDTGNSIRGPSSHNGLVGIRSTMGRTSRDGIVPLYLDHDIGGPMARTVTDAALVFSLIAGPDPADPVTLESAEYPLEAWQTWLDPKGLRGARLGVVRQLTREIDPEVSEVFTAALADLRRGEAIVVDPVEIPELDSIPRGERWCPRFRHDLDAYLASLGDAAPYANLEAIRDSGLFHPSVQGGIDYFLEVEPGPPESLEICRTAWRRGEELAAGVRRVLEVHQLDALVFPTWSFPPRLIGDLNTPAGDNSQDLSPHTGFPAVTVPMGWVRLDSTPAGLPVGLQLVGDAWSEAILIRLAYAYEQRTQHRRPPVATPPLSF